ncbi:hypothetical protein DB459_21570 [Bradyrhizobium sp. WD16]|nr:hypothetical protein DB459_21570 [Bradyrhizobium sp. WD16]
MQLQSTITCPRCSHEAVETMPADACQQTTSTLPSTSVALRIDQCGVDANQPLGGIRVRAWPQQSGVLSQACSQCPGHPLSNIASTTCGTPRRGGSIGSTHSACSA